jgi:hypothetical protein
MEDQKRCPIRMRYLPKDLAISVPLCRKNLPDMNKCCFLMLVVTAFSIPLDAQCDEATTSQSPQPVIRVLGIGNSFTENAIAYLGTMSEQCDGCQLVIGRATIGGCSLEKHVRLARIHETNPEDPEGRAYSIWRTDPNGKRSRHKVGLMEILESDKWDVVTIQQLSRKSTDISTYRPFARQLYNYVKRYAPQAEVVIHQTWAYRTDGDFAKVFPDKPGYGQESMYADLSRAYATIAEELDVRIIPVGAAFQLARKERPYRPDPNVTPSELQPKKLPHDLNSLCAGWHWKEDGDDYELRCDTHHAGPLGKYLAAAVWLEFLTGRRPCEQGIQIPAVSDEQAKFLCDVAHRALQIQQETRLSIAP